MATASSRSAHEAQQSAFTVETPRASDAIAAALRETYTDGKALPDDMVAMLDQIDGRGTRRG